MKASCAWATLVAALIAALGVSAAAAGEANSRADFLAPPAATGKPLVFVPPPAPPQAAPACAPLLPCGTRLIGTVRRNGAVEIAVPALRW